jgi:hypothetical protein
LIQCPKAVGDCEEHPERPAPQLFLYPVADGEPGRQKEEQKIKDRAVRKYGRVWR